MMVRFTRGRDGKEPVLTCVRDDGSVTWQKSSEYFVRHDLIHYAVEITLGYRNAFLGLVAGGRGLEDFGTRGSVKDMYTDEEWWAELIVSALQFPSAAGGPAASEDEVIDAVVKSCSDSGNLAPAITAEQVHAIGERIRELHRLWSRLPEGEALDLTFYG